MSDSAPQDTRTGKGPFLIVGALLVAGLLLLVTQSGIFGDRQIDRSPIGVQGLGAWLDRNDIAVTNSHPRLSPAVADLSFRVLPLYDLDLTGFHADREKRDDPAGAETLRDITATNLRTKLKEIPTLVLLPKWNGAMVETEVAHEQSLIPLARIERLIGQLDISGVELVRGVAEFYEDNQGGHDLALFHAQVFNPSTLPAQCRAEVGYGLGALVVSCPLAEASHRAYFASDPDTLNNHGLAVADNAAFALDLLTDLRGADTNPIYIDRSPDLLTRLDRGDERQDYDRGFEELERFFDYPFTLFWAALLIVLAVLFWRGALRFGPIRQAAGQGRDTSKRAAIAAKARLLRLSGNDGRMVSDFVRAQLQDLAARSFGRDLGGEAEARFMSLLARRDPDLARDFGACARNLIDNAPGMPPAQLNRMLGQYHSLLAKVVEHHGPV
jgi:hypothetical protein